MNMLSVGAYHVKGAHTTGFPCVLKDEAERILHLFNLFFHPLKVTGKLANEEIGKRGLRLNRAAPLRRSCLRF